MTGIGAAFSTNHVSANSGRVVRYVGKSIHLGDGNSRKSWLLHGQRLRLDNYTMRDDDGIEWSASQDGFVRLSDTRPLHHAYRYHKHHKSLNYTPWGDVRTGTLHHGIKINGHYWPRGTKLYGGHGGDAFPLPNGAYPSKYDSWSYMGKPYGPQELVPAWAMRKGRIHHYSVKPAKKHALKARKAKNKKAVKYHAHKQTKKFNRKPKARKAAFKGNPDYKAVHVKGFKDFTGNMNYAQKVWLRIIKINARAIKNDQNTLKHTKANSPAAKKIQSKINVLIKDYHYAVQQWAKAGK